MQEYLSTTTLGDLRRKARETSTQTAFGSNAGTANTGDEAAAEQPTTGAAITNSNTEIGSNIRPNIGEINQ